MLSAVLILALLTALVATEPAAGGRERGDRA
ncbi:hypothetical protein SAMN05444173_3386 [Opitutus sp. GAS368]|jgi:hypothetical protein|nr:hypothetical protein SAMN05444173_3386 [Opitutus sp. GAS368]